MPFILLLYLLVAFTLFILPAVLKKQQAYIVSVLQLGVFVWFLFQLPGILHQEVRSVILEWVPQLGINLVFLLDGLSISFALLVTGIGALVFYYARAYMKNYEQASRFFFYLTLFSGAMLGLVLSGNLIQLFIFWELTSIFSFLLIAFFHEKEEARKSAFQSLFITFFGGLGLLAGILLLGSIPGSYLLADWVESADEIRNSTLYLPGLLLILAGVFTKSAQFPFHFWLPGAMQAPTPVSAYLHSATMVKAGFFLLARLSPVLGGTQEWTYLISSVGILTMLTGAYFSITQTDLKGILAYTTIYALGVLVLLMGIDTPLSLKAAMLFLFVHALYKAALFMIAGTIDKKAGTRDISKLSGLGRYMPISFFTTVLAALSMAGLPPMLGFLGKELIYEAKLQVAGIAGPVLILGVASNMLMVAVSISFTWKIFLGRWSVPDRKPDEKGSGYVAGPLILVLLSLLLGLFPGLLGESLIEAALNVMYTGSYDVKLKLWHGFNEVFFLSLFTIISGTLLAVIILRKEDFLHKWRTLNSYLVHFRLVDAFAYGLERYTAFAARKDRLVQHGYHRYYLMTIILFTAVLLWIQAWLTRGWELEMDLSFRPFYVTGLFLVVVLAVVLSMVSRSRVTTIIAMGVSGYGIALIFMYYSAVDLAITQILVETLTVVVFLLVLQRLPRFATLSSKVTRLRDLGIALAFGSVMSVIALKALQVNFHSPVSGYFVENSYTRAFGKNVVNVILVDFRAWDTLGEVVVLTIAALGVFVLLNKKKEGK